MVFKENAAKILKIGRMGLDVYIPAEEDPDIIMTMRVPVALSIVHNHLANSTFCDRFMTPLSSVARNVRQKKTYTYDCHGYLVALDA